MKLEELVKKIEKDNYISIFYRKSNNELKNLFCGENHAIDRYYLESEVISVEGEYDYFIKIIIDYTPCVVLVEEDKLRELSDVMEELKKEFEIANSCFDEKYKNYTENQKVVVDKYNQKIEELRNFIYEERSKNEKQLF